MRFRMDIDIGGAIEDSLLQHLEITSLQGVNCLHITRYNRPHHG